MGALKFLLHADWGGSPAVRHSAGFEGRDSHESIELKSLAVVGQAVSTGLVWGLILLW